MGAPAEETGSTAIPQRVETEEMKKNRERWQAKAQAEHAGVLKVAADKKAAEEAGKAKAALDASTSSIKEGITGGTVGVTTAEFEVLLMAASSFLIFCLSSV